MEQFENGNKWFVQYQGQVQGPFNTGYLQSTLERLDANHLESTLVWRRGLAEWIKASKWQSVEHDAPLILQEIESEVPLDTAPVNQETTIAASAPIPKKSAPPMKASTFPPPPPQTPQSFNPPPSNMRLGVDEDTVVGHNIEKPQSLNQGAFYRVQVNFVDQPAMTKNELLNLIAKQDDISAVAIQDPKSKEWKEVYAYPDIVDRLGLSRRKHPRVPILAQFTGRSNRHETFTARIITISEGGLGLTEVYDLKIGDEVQGQMTSPHFFQPINVRADVVYSGLDGYIGLNFSQINDESKSAIIEYMKKFGKSSGGNPQA